MADTFTDLLGARKQETGANENTWGDLLNQDTIDVFDAAIAGAATHSVTGGTVDLSADPLVEQAHIFTGTLSSDLTVKIPSLSKRMLVFNNTSGSFFMLLQTSSGSPVCIPQGTMKAIWSVGDNNVYREDREKVGTQFYHMGTSAPAGAFVMDGSAKSRTLTPDLYAKIGTTHGVGNGVTTYNLPDQQTNNRYLRASGGSLSVGNTQTDDVKPHSHSASGTTSVAGTTDGNGDHNHSGTTGTESNGHIHGGGQAQNQGGQTSNGAGTSNGFGGSGNIWYGGAINTGSENSNHTHDFTTSTNGNHSHNVSASGSVSVTVSNSTGTETRPHTLVALSCIWY